MSDHDPYDLAEVAERDEHRRQKDQLRSDAEDADLVWLMSGGPRGRRIVWRLLERAGLYRVCSPLNAMALAHAEGRRDTARWLIGEIERLCPQHYLTMLEEQQNDRAASGDRSTTQH